MYKLKINKDNKMVSTRTFRTMEELRDYKKQITNNPLGIYYEAII